jgi:hypothetical protein
MKWEKKGMKNYERTDKQNCCEKNNGEDRDGIGLDVEMFVRNFSRTF